MLLMPMLRPIRLDGTGPNAIIVFYLSINFESIPFENGAIFYFKAVLVEHLHSLKNPQKDLPSCYGDELLRGSMCLFAMGWVVISLV